MFPVDPGLPFPVLMSCSGTAGRALAAYPERTITMIIPFGAGGATDVIGRYIALHLGKRLGQTIIVKNIAGSGGVIGMTELAKSRPDGYTIGFSPVAPLIMQPNFRKTMYVIFPASAPSHAPRTNLCSWRFQRKAPSRT